MKKIYEIQIANNFQFLSLDRLMGPLLEHGINRTNILADWIPFDLDFQSVGKRKRAKPDITCIFGVSGIAFPLSQKEEIFPTPCEDLEFLPFRVSGEEWLIVHCLKTTDKYDPSRSQFSRDLDKDFSASLDDERLLEMLRSSTRPADFIEHSTGEIFMVQKLTVKDASLENCELFTIADSNRTSLFALPSFVERIKKLNLQGITFKEIGILESDE